MADTSETIRSGATGPTIRWSTADDEIVPQNSGLQSDADSSVLEDQKNTDTSPRTTHQRPILRHRDSPGHIATRDGVRFRGRSRTSSANSVDHSFYNYATSMDFEVMYPPENEIEAHRMANNYLFGFRKWKSHISSRPLERRSELVRQLYKQDESPTPVTVCTCGNILYVVLFGWWVALMYLIIALMLTLTVIGFKYAHFCFTLSKYFFWPFGKFVYQGLPPGLLLSNSSLHGAMTSSDTSPDVTVETAPLNPQSGYSTYNSLGDDSTSIITRSSPQRLDYCHHGNTRYWKRPETYLWLLLGLPLLFITHSLAFLLSWMPIVSIPVAKIHIRTIQKILLLPPELLMVQQFVLNDEEAAGDIIMYTYQAFNAYYYKYTVDGMNVVFVNMLFFVLLTVFAGYLDTDSKYFTMPVKFTLALVSVIPLAYYIGMGVSSISAQSNYAVGAVLNATFGSIVEIILYLTALYKGRQQNMEECYQGLVKAGLVGTLLATTLLIPGLSMVAGGIKHKSLRFNPTSAGVTATLLFVSVAAVFAPTIFAQTYSLLKCDNCHAYNISNQSEGLQCQSCRTDALGVPENNTMYQQHVLPLIYTCSALLPLAYVVGMVFSLHTHKAVVHDGFLSEIGDKGAGHGNAQWSRLKSGLLLLLSVVLMSLCADILTYNIQPLLSTGISVYFVGVTFLALVPDIPEIVIGIQFALQNNISLSIEMGSCIAVQVCMLQIPILVYADLVHSNGFYLLFSEIHIWTVIIGVLLNNYVFQDGRSNYFQGSALVLTYCALVAMYFFAPSPPGLKC